MRVSAIIAVFLLACPLTIAQQTPEEVAAFRHVHDSHSRFSTTHGLEDEQLKDLVDAYMLVRIKDTLDLSDLETLKLVEQIGSYKKELTRLKFLEGILREQLRHKTTQGVNDDLVKSDLDVLMQTGSQIAEELRGMVENSRKTLSMVQSAQLYLFVDDFEQEILQLIDQARQMHHSETQQKLDPTSNHDEVEAMSAFRALVQFETRKLNMPDDDEKDIIDLVDAWMMVEMMAALDLPKAKFGSLITHVGQYKDQLYQMKWQIGDSRAQLRSDIALKAREDLIALQLENLLMQESAVADLVEAFVTEAQKDVSVAMSAKMLLFMVEFEYKVLALIERAGQDIQ